MKHIRWKKASYLVYVMLFILTLYLLSKVHLNLQYSAKHVTDDYYFYCILSSVMFCFLGFLSAKQWFLYFLSSNKSIDFKLLALGIALFALGLIPVMLWFIWLGIYANFFAMIVQSTYVNHALNMIAGMVIAKSLK